MGWLCWWSLLYIERKNCNQRQVWSDSQNFYVKCLFWRIWIINKTKPTKKYITQIILPRVTLSSISKKDFNPTLTLILNEFPEIEYDIKATARIFEQRIGDADYYTLQSFLTRKRDFNKAKASHEGSETPNKEIKSMIIRQVGNFFSRTVLELKTNGKLNDATGLHMGWLLEFRERKEGNKRFIAQNSMKELS